MKAKILILSAVLATKNIAATYYVDYKCGNNSADGATKETAWKHAPGNDQATGIPAGTKLNAGDIVAFKGGVVYAGGLSLKSSGLTGAPIIYDGNGSGAYGNGRAVIDRENVQKSAFSFQKNTSQIVIRGFEIRNVGGYAENDPLLQMTEPQIKTPKTGTAINLTAGGNKGIVLQDLFVHQVGQWRNQKPFSGAQSVTGQGIAIEDADGVTIENCEFTKMRTPISIKATTAVRNIDINGCDLHDYIVWGIDIAPRKNGAVLENIAIRNTKIRDYHQFDSGNWFGWGEKPHTDGIFLRASGMKSTWKNILIQGCQFYSTNSGKSKGGTASIYVSEGPSVDIVKNSFIRDPHSATISIAKPNITASGLQTVRIEGNTFIGGPSHILMNGEKNPEKREVIITGNIFYRDALENSVMVNVQGGVLPNVLDGNTYQSSIHAQTKKKVAFLQGKGGYLTFAKLRAAEYEQNGKFETVPVNKQP